MILNLDQTPVGFTSPKKTTYSDRGSGSEPITNVDNKLRITFTLSLSLEVLPIQLIYGGLTDKCHPRVKFPINFISLIQTTIGQIKTMYWILAWLYFRFYNKNERIEFRSRHKSSPIF